MSSEWEPEKEAGDRRVTRVAFPGGGGTVALGDM